MTLSIETRQPVVTKRVALERDMISPDLVAETVRTALDDILLTTPGALNWETVAVTLEAREQPATAPAPSVYMDLVATVELLP